MHGPGSGGDVGAGVGVGVGSGLGVGVGTGDDVGVGKEVGVGIEVGGTADGMVWTTGEAAADGVGSDAPEVGVVGLGPVFRAG